MRRLTDVDLRLVRIFRVIVECQGLTAAELVLNLSQSRISASLAELEARLGVKLCRRGRSGFSLTEAGAIVYEASHELVGAVERFNNRAGVVAAKLKRTLRLGVVDAVVTNPDLPLPAVLGAFREQNPAVVVDLTNASPEELERQLVAGRRDAVVMPCTQRKSELSYRPVLSERQSLCCGRDHPLFGLPDDAITDAMLGEHGFVARGYLHHSDLRRIGRREEQATVDMMEAQLILILSGQFIGYLPAHYARGWEDRGMLRAIRPDQYDYASEFFIVTLGGATENPLVSRFSSALAGAAEGRSAPALPAAE